MFSISIRDEGCDVKIIVVEIIGDSESEYRGNTLSHLSGCRWGEEKRKRVTQIRRWGYILTRDDMHKSQNIHILQEYILTSSKCFAMRKVYVWNCVSKMSLCFQSPFGTVQCLFVIEKQFIAKSLSVRRHNIFETLSISKHF